MTTAMTDEELVAWRERIAGMYAQGAAISQQAAEEDRKLRAYLIEWCGRPLTPAPSPRVQGEGEEMKGG